MSKKSIIATKTFLEIAIQVVLFTSISFALFMGLFNPPLEKAASVLYVAVVVVVAYAARCHIKSAGLFLLVHIVLVVVGMIIGARGSEEESFVIGLSAFVVTLVSFAFRKMRTENKGEFISIAFVLIFVVEYFSGFSAGNNAVMECAIWCTVLFVLLYMFYANYVRIENLFFMNAGTSNFPRKRITSTNNAIIALTGVMTLLGMLVFYNGQLGNIITIIKNMFLKLLGIFLGWLIKQGGDDEPVKDPIVLETESEHESETFGTLEEINMPLRDFLNALFVIIAIIIIIVAIYFIVKAFIKMYSYIGKIESTESDVIEDIEDDIVEDVEILKRKKETEISDTDLNLKARKIYKKNVKGVKKEKGVPRDAALAKDITKMFNDGELSDEITSIYEKARYSNESVTKEEVDIIKKNT